MKKRLVSIFLAIVMCISLVACGSAEKAPAAEAPKADAPAAAPAETTELKKIVVSVSADMPIINEKAAGALAKRGYYLEEVVNEGATLLQSVKDGITDCDWCRHGPSLDAFIENYGGDLVMLEPKVLVTPYGIYSNKMKSMDDVQDGMTVAMSDSAYNRERSLLMLQDCGIIKMADAPTDKYYAVSDIAENPYNLEFIEVQQMSLWSLMPDVDIVILPISYVSEQGGDTSTYLHRERSEKYAMGIVVRAEDKDADWAIAMNEAFHDEEFTTALAEAYPDVYDFIK